LLKLLSEKLGVKNKALFAWFLNAGSFKMCWVQYSKLQK